MATQKTTITNPALPLYILQVRTELKSELGLSRITGDAYLPGDEVHKYF